MPTSTPYPPGLDHHANDLLSGALCLVLRHHLTGCHQAGAQAARLLDLLANTPDMDRDSRFLYEQASQLLAQHGKRN